ncbi:MAG: hypothetical protein H0U75_01920 [Legionella sp.]|nr:hypothetical protein [Legionella sp.]
MKNILKSIELVFSTVFILVVMSTSYAAVEQPAVGKLMKCETNCDCAKKCSGTGTCEGGICRCTNG